MLGAVYCFDFYQHLFFNPLYDEAIQSLSIQQALRIKTEAACVVEAFKGRNLLVNGSLMITCPWFLL